MIQDALYTSPNGKEASFLWETGKRKTRLKTGVYEFPGRDGAHVQHQGAGARTFPLMCIFSGRDCMEKADSFEDMLKERGVGELQHPTYGTFKVVPTGDIEREDDPVNRNGESRVTITFTETITDDDADNLTEVAAQAIDEKLEEFQNAAVTDFAAAIMTDDVTTKMSIISALNATLENITGALHFVATLDKKLFGNWLASVKELKGNIEKLYQQGLNVVGKAEDLYVTALNIGRLTLRVMQLPANLSISLAEKIKGYATLTANLIQQYKNDPFGVEKMKAAYATASLALTGACAAIASGSALSIAEVAAMTGATKPFAAPPKEEASAEPPTALSMGGVSPAASMSAGTASREEAIEAANQMAVFLETVMDFQDTKIEQNTFVDSSPTAHLALTELVYASIQLILNASFALPMQKTITLDRDRQAVELCAELYGTTDCLDNFIIQNNFNIDEIGLLPMGKKVSFYVQSA
jgi:prophage DNA circulation protein